MNLLRTLLETLFTSFSVRAPEDNGLIILVRIHCLHTYSSTYSLEESWDKCEVKILLKDYIVWNNLLLRQICKNRGL